MGVDAFIGTLVHVGDRFGGAGARSGDDMQHGQRIQGLVIPNPFLGL